MSDYSESHKRLIKLREILASAGIEPPFSKESLAVGLAVLNSFWQPPRAKGRPKLNRLFSLQSGAVVAWFRAANFLGIYDEEGELWDPPENSWRLAMRQASLYFSDINDKRPPKTLERHLSETRAIFNQFNYAEGLPFWNEVLRYYDLLPPSPEILLGERYRSLREPRGPKPL